MGSERVSDIEADFVAQTARLRKKVDREGRLALDLLDARAALRESQEREKALRGGPTEEYRLSESDLDRCVMEAGDATDYGWAVKDLLQAHWENAALRAQVEALESMICDECRDSDGRPTGWVENRVEGRAPCVCMTEMEPYQALEEENRRLREAYKVATEPLRNCGWTGICGEMARAIVQRSDSALQERQP